MFVFFLSDGFLWYLSSISFSANFPAKLLKRIDVVQAICIFIPKLVVHNFQSSATFLLIVNPSLQALSTTAIVRLNLVITDNQPMLIHMLGCKRRQNFIFSNKVLYLALVVCINFEIKIFIFFISLTIFRNNFQTKNIIVSS